MNNRIYALLIVISTLGLCLSACKEESSAAKLPESNSFPSSSSSSSSSSSPPSASDAPASTSSSPDSASSSSDSHYGARSGDASSEDIPDPIATAGAESQQTDATSASASSRDNQRASEGERGRESAQQGQNRSDTEENGAAQSTYGSGYDYEQSTAGQASDDGGLTPDEQIAILDAQLKSSLGVFDGMILTERANAQANDQGIEDGLYDTDGDDDGYEDGDSLFEEADLAHGGDGYGDGDASTSSGSQSADGDNGANSGTAKSKSAGVPGTHTAKSAVIPDDISDGSDDDIVARQIREAAMRESDPELRDKLWSEYRKYKNGAR